MICYLKQGYNDYAGGKMDFDKDVKQQYRGEEGKKYHDAVNYVPEKAYPWVARLRRDKIIPFINEQDVLLEYGVGTGWNIAQIKCKKRMGYDLAEHLESELERQGIEFIKDITSIPDESINVVICHHVLEHISNPPDTLKEINRILCKGGKLLLFVPYETDRKYHHYDPQEPNHHLYSWNVQTIGTLVEKMGFQVTNGSIKRFGYDRFSSVWAEKLHMGEFGFRLIRRMIHFIKPVSEVCIVATPKN